MREAKQKEMFEISDLRREILHLSVRLFVHQFNPIPSYAYKWAFVLVGVLSQWAFVQVGFCPSGLMS